MSFSDGIILLVIGTLAGIAIWRRPEGAGDVISRIIDIFSRRKK